jgi:hypothetical protein
LNQVRVFLSLPYARSSHIREPSVLADGIACPSVNRHRRLLFGRAGPNSATSAGGILGGLLPSDAIDVDQLSLGI